MGTTAFNARLVRLTEELEALKWAYEVAVNSVTASSAVYSANDIATGSSALVTYKITFLKPAEGENRAIFTNVSVFASGVLFYTPDYDDYTQCFTIWRTSAAQPFVITSTQQIDSIERIT